MTLSAIPSKPAPLARFGRFLHRWNDATQREYEADLEAQKAAHVARRAAWRAAHRVSAKSPRRQQSPELETIGWIICGLVGVALGAWLLPTGTDGLLVLILLVLLFKR